MALTPDSFVSADGAKWLKQTCGAIKNLLRGELMPEHTRVSEGVGGAQLRGNHKENLISLWFPAALALSTLNSRPGFRGHGRAPKSGNRSQHLNGSKWHQNKAPSAKKSQMTETHCRGTRPNTGGTHYEPIQRQENKREGEGGSGLKQDTKENWVVKFFMFHQLHCIWCFFLVYLHNKYIFKIDRHILLKKKKNNV